jgi:hypothetical protein
MSKTEERARELREEFTFPRYAVSGRFKHFVLVLLTNCEDELKWRPMTCPVTRDACREATWGMNVVDKDGVRIGSADIVVRLNDDATPEQMLQAIWGLR